MSWYLKVLQNYAVFDGRARRKEYWMFALVNFCVSLLLTLVDLAAFGGLQILSGIYGLAILVPSIAVSVRRLHDIGKSGWYLFISLIPLIGGIWLLILTVTDSDEGANQYGENPKLKAY